MRSRNILDIKKRSLFKQNEIKKKIFNSLTKKEDFIIKINLNLQCNKVLKNILKKRDLYNIKKLFKQQKYLYKSIGSKSKIVNRCVITGRARGIVSKFKLSRLCVKKFMKERQLIGFIRENR